MHLTLLSPELMELNEERQGNVEHKFHRQVPQTYLAQNSE